MTRYYTERFVRTTDGADLWYSVSGEEGPTLIFCDGLGCDGFAWKHLARLLGDQFRIVRWNYRGHGRSGLPGDDRRIGLEYFAEDLELVLRDAGVENGVLVGHSMGVQVGFEYYKRYPERVLAMVPICGSYGYPLDTFHDSDTVKRIFPYVKAITERLPGLARRVTRTLLPTELAFQVARIVEVNRYLVRREDFMPYFHHLGAMDPVIFLRTLASAASHTAWDLLPHVQVPTLVVAGERDRFTPMWLSERMHQAIPGSELLVVPSGTHTAPIELPELIALRMERFFKDRLELPAQLPARQARKVVARKRARKAAGA